jgi:hypothetical protein
VAVPDTSNRNIRPLKPPPERNTATALLPTSRVDRVDMDLHPEQARRLTIPPHSITYPKSEIDRHSRPKL